MVADPLVAVFTQANMGFGTFSLGSAPPIDPAFELAQAFEVSDYMVFNEGAAFEESSPSVVAGDGGSCSSSIASSVMYVVLTCMEVLAKF